MNDSRPSPKGAVRLFVSYAHQDDDFRTELEQHLSPIVREGLITTWHDRKIVAGTDWSADIQRHLHEAQIVVLLVSASFIASDECQREMEIAFQRHTQGATRVIPIISRAVVWERSRIRSVQVLPRDALPIDQWPNRDAAWTHVAQAIREAAEQIAAAVRQSAPEPLRPDDLAGVRRDLRAGHLDKAIRAIGLATRQLQSAQLHAQARDLDRRLVDLTPIDPEALAMGRAPVAARDLADATMHLCDDLERAAQPLFPKEPQCDPSTDLLNRRRFYVRCVNLTKTYKHRFSLQETSFDLDCGDIAGVVGANGSGKSTLLRMIAGDLAPSAGRIEIASVDDHQRPVFTQVAFVPQAPARWSGLLRNYLTQQAAFYGYTSVAENADAVGHVISFLSLGKYQNHFWNELSGGYRTRAAIAAVMVANPGLLVLDEPLAALDPRGQQQLLEEIEAFARIRKTAVVVSSQHIAEVEAIADVVLVLGLASVYVARKANRPAEPPARTIFEVGAQRAFLLEPTFQEMKRTNRIVAYDVRRTSAALMFEGNRTIADVATLLGGTEVESVREITRSSARFGYTLVGH